MVKISIVFATTEGQTRKIATAACARFEALGWSVALIDASANPGPGALDGADAAMLLGSLHAHKFQKMLQHFARENAGLLNAIPSSFCAVSLSAMGDEEERAGAQGCVDAFLDAAGWRPTAIQHVAGALLFTKYDFFKAWIMKRIAKAHGLEVKRGEDVEFTDWTAFNAFCSDFASRAMSTEQVRDDDRS